MRWTYITKKYHKILITVSSCHLMEVQRWKHDGKQVFCICQFNRDGPRSFCTNSMVQCSPNSTIAPWHTVGTRVLVGGCAMAQHMHWTDPKSCPAWWVVLSYLLKSCLFHCLQGHAPVCVVIVSLLLPVSTQHLMHVCLCPVIELGHLWPQHLLLLYCCMPLGLTLAHAK